MAKLCTKPGDLATTNLGEREIERTLLLQTTRQKPNTRPNKFSFGDLRICSTKKFSMVGGLAEGGLLRRLERSARGWGGEFTRFTRVAAGELENPSRRGLLINFVLRRTTSRT